MRRRRPPTALRRVPAFATVLAAATVAMGPRPAEATAQTSTPDAFAGRWDVTWDQAIRTSGSRVLDVQRRGNAILTLEQHADSLDGTWVVPALGQPQHVVGVVHGDSMTLYTRNAVIHDGGRDIPIAMRWFGVLKEGEITGTMYVQIGNGEPPPRAWEAVMAGPEGRRPPTAQGHPHRHHR